MAKSGGKMKIKSIFCYELYCDTEKDMKTKWSLDQIDCAGGKDMWCFK